MTPKILRAALAGTLALVLFTSSSNATIVGGAATAGDAMVRGGEFETLTLPLSNPSGQPNSVGNDNFDSNNFFAFDEDQNIVLTSPLQVDLLASTGNSGSLAAGTTVASHYLFFDPGPSRHIVGTVDFDSAVLAVITSTANLAASDFLAQTGVDYLNPRLRGLEARDVVTITGLQQIEVDFRASSPGDYIRVLTDFSPGAAQVSASGINHTSIPLAVDDRASTLEGQRILIDVMANDRGLDDTPISLELLSVPINSRAFVRSEFIQGDNQVEFHPLPGLYGEQTLIYQVTDADGDTATGNVVVDVACADCTETPNITLRWTPIPGDVDGYRVFFGGTPTTADNPVSDVTTNSVTYNAGTDLGLRLGDDVCFRVTAYNQWGESDFSSAVCETLSAPLPPGRRQRQSPADNTATPRSSERRQPQSPADNTTTPRSSERRQPQSPADNTATPRSPERQQPQSPSDNAASPPLAREPATAIAF
jgi:hypothetical protein